MPFIIIAFEGQKTFGGYLKIDGGREITLSDDLIIAIDEGVHRIDYSNKPTAVQGLTNLNAALGNERTAAWADRDTVAGGTTEEFGPLDVMKITIVSDGSGHVLDMPTTEIRTFEEEGYNNLVDIYNERIVAQEEHEKNTVGIELILCLILGGLGGHKFYRGQFGWGIAYLFTGGLFGIGWFIDFIKILIKFIKYKKA